MNIPNSAVFGAFSSNLHAMLSFFRSQHVKLQGLPEVLTVALIVILVLLAFAMKTNNIFVSNLARKRKVIASPDVFLASALVATVVFCLVPGPASFYIASFAVIVLILLAHFAFKLLTPKQRRRKAATTATHEFS